MTAPQARRWVTPEGARVDLFYLTHTRGALSAGLRDGGALDGWCLTVTHPSGVLISDTYLGARLDETALAAALADVEAYEVTDLPAPPPPPKDAP